ncbi:MAG: UDP-3-O-acyl-N-acetylglucosamine deacetylase [Alphaproteobacteria bacterium]|nr:UDP-3-O-acyl-N-acetylglucosamine deacetylase [Alphaproteobacteria bacterium]
MEQQQTLQRRITCTGIGLHGGTKVTMALQPAPVDSGVVFVRTDVPTVAARIAARWDSVCETTMCTTIANRWGTRVGTIEHLMAALLGLGIDNVVVELNGPEVPIMDGSAAPFVFLIECAGVQRQDAPRRPIKVLRAVEVVDGGRRARLVPADHFGVDFEIIYDNPLIARQRHSFAHVGGAFKSEISRARTFGFFHEVEQLWALGLAKGGSLDNAVVVRGTEVLNEGGLRYHDEFVRHKVLDSMGDLFLAGAPLLARFEGVCCGHTLNNRLLHALFANRDAWSQSGPARVATEEPEFRLAAAG